MIPDCQQTANQLDEIEIEIKSDVSRKTVMRSPLTAALVLDQKSENKDDVTTILMILSILSIAMHCGLMPS